MLHLFSMPPLTRWRGSVLYLSIRTSLCAFIVVAKAVVGELKFGLGDSNLWGWLVQVSTNWTGPFFRLLSGTGLTDLSPD